MTENICCLCLSKDKIVKSMFADEDSDISDKIVAISGVKFDQFDVLPTGVCIDCLVKLEDAYKLRLMVLNSYASLQFLYNPTSSADGEESPTYLDCMPLEVDLDVKPEDLLFPDDMSEHEGPQSEDDQIKTLIELSRLLSPPPLVTDPSNPFICEICGHSFDSKKSVVNHVIADHTAKQSTADLLPRKRNAEELPHQPPKVTVTTTTTIAAFDCEVCGQPFANKSEVVTHVLQNHTAAKNYQQRGSRKYHTCLRCDRKFVGHEHLASHALTCAITSSLMVVKQRSGIRATGAADERRQ